MRPIDSRVGIVVVTYNSAGFLGPCLESALRVSSRVVVVDNGSRDHTTQVTSNYGVQLIANSTNRGFAAAANQGIEAAGSRYVLLLNPDATLESGVESMADAFRPGIGVVAGKLVHPTGEAQEGFVIRRFPTAWTLAFEAVGLNRVWKGNPVNRRYRCLDDDLDTAQEVEQPAGAFIMIDRRVWELLGGFDESFQPLWFEDVDFLRRVKWAGYGIWYSPSARAIHYGGHSIQGLARGDRQTYWYGNMLRYSSKYFGTRGCRLVAAAAIVGCGVRYCGDVIQGKGVRALTDYGKVVRLAASYALRGRERRRPSTGSSGIQNARMVGEQFK